MYNESTQMVLNMVLALKKNVGWIKGQKYMTIFNYAADHNVFLESDEETYIAVEDEVIKF